MQIETFEIQTASSEASGLAIEGASLELIEKLGLEGQKSFTQVIGGETSVVVNPFRALEEREMLVYSTLCPQKSDIKSYKVDSIPLRILEIADKAMSTGLYHKLEVWYPKEARIDDPVLVGIIQEKVFYNSSAPSAFYTNDKLHLLARWGKVLPSFEQCEAMALDMLKKSTLSHLNKVIAKAKMSLEGLKDSAEIMDFGKDIEFGKNYI